MITGRSMSKSLKISPIITIRPTIKINNIKKPGKPKKVVLMLSLGYSVDSH